ncbi:MAG: hypothetical protein ACLVL7_14405 [Anaerotruncus massiliensis (ex Togo et al. 2019)]
MRTSAGPLQFWCSKITTSTCPDRLRRAVRPRMGARRPPVDGRLRPIRPRRSRPRRSPIRCARRLPAYRYSYDAQKNVYRGGGGRRGEWPRCSLSTGGPAAHLLRGWTEGYAVRDGEGNASEASGQKVYSAVMTVELLDGGGFQYRSVQVLPEEAA